MLAAPPRAQRPYAGVLRHAAVLQFESTSDPPKILEGLAKRSLLGDELQRAISELDDAVFAFYQCHGSAGFEAAIAASAPEWCAVRTCAQDALRRLRDQRS